MKKALYVATIFLHLKSFHIPFMKMLKQKGFEVWAAAANTDDFSKRALEDIGIKCIEVPFSRNPYNISNLKAYKFLRNFFKKNHFDLLHFHTPVASFIGRIAARNTNQGTIVYTAHGFHFYKGAPIKNWLIYYTAEKIARKWTDILITINSEDFENGKKLGYIPNKSLFLTHGVGIDVDAFKLPNSIREKKRRELSIPKNAVVFICIGELNKNKNQKWLLKVWKQLQDSNIYLLLVGDGPLKTKLDKFAAKNNIKNVKFLGFRNDIPQLLKASDVLISVSKREGLPRNIMEAMAAGLPVIGTNIRGTRDLLFDNTGILTDLESVESLKNAIIKLANSAKLRLYLGKTASKKVANISVESIMKELIKIYEIF